MRGPHGGYELAGEHRRIRAEDILRTAGAAEDADNPPLRNSVRLWSTPRANFRWRLAVINVEDMAKRADALK